MLLIKFRSASNPSPRLISCPGTSPASTTSATDAGSNHLRASLFVSGFDIDLRVIGLLKTVTFAGAVAFSGAKTEDIAQWVNLVGSAPENVTGSL